MAMLDGKQVRDGTIPASKLVAPFLATLLRSDGSVAMAAAFNANNNRIVNLGAPQSQNDAARLADILAIPWKAAARAATTANVVLSGEQTIDGVPLVSGDRVLVRVNTNAAENGVYIVSTGTWDRASDTDSATELRGAVVTILEGSLNADKRFAQTVDTITLGTTALTFVDIGTGTPAAFDTSANKLMTASATTADFQVATATVIAGTPAGDAYVRISVNGLGCSLGDGVRTRDAYFSADSGTTAKTIAAIAAGDSLYWVQSVAGYNLATTDVIDFEYAV